jgi:hypothetical protein
MALASNSLVTSKAAFGLLTSGVSPQRPSQGVTYVDVVTEVSFHDVTIKTFMFVTGLFPIVIVVL